METLREMWSASCRQNARDVALVYGDLRRTYAEIAERGRRLASALYAAGARRQHRVSMMAMNCPQWIDLYAACNTAGFIVGTINFRLAAAEVEYILRDSQPTVLIFEEEYATHIDSIRAELSSVKRFVCVGRKLDWADEFETFLASGDAAGAPIEARPDDIAHLIYTSGTTGRPKGVMRSQRAEVKLSEGIAMAMSMRQDGSILLVMPLFHIGALAQAFGQILCGGTLVVHRHFEPVAILETIAGERINYVHLAPTMVQGVFDVANVRDYDLSSVEVFCYAAAPMPVSLLKRGLELLGPVMLDMYGGTEMGPVATLYRHRHKLDGSERDVARLASVGQASPCASVRIVDENAEELPPNVTGELAVSGGTLMSGYWNNTVATLDAIRDGWYLTGDMAYMDEEGYIFLVDRKKDMIISGGENIYCREVEEALMEHGTISDVAVIGVPDVRWGEAVKAIAIRRIGADVSAEQLIEFCKTRIARYKSPKSVEFVDELPRLPSGKISKLKLREQFRA